MSCAARALAANFLELHDPARVNKAAAHARTPLVPSHQFYRENVWVVVYEASTKTTAIGCHSIV